MVRRWVVVVVVLSAATRVARAGVWYYTWNCSGQCAPNQLAITGREGPFASQDECDSVRSADSRRETFVAEGNLGGLDFCRDSDDGSGTSSGGSSHPPAPLQRFSLGALGGEGWHVVDPSASYPAGGRTAGLDMNLVLGWRPLFGVEMSIGFQHTSVTAPIYGAAPKSMNMIPWYIGFSSSPPLFRGNVFEARLDLGADVGALFRNGCEACDVDGLSSGGFIAALRAGLDLYFGHSKPAGLGFDAIFTFGQMGNLHASFTPSALEIAPPQVLFRVSVIFRNTKMNW